MRLEMLAKEEASGRSGCPSIYVDEDGWMVVQGPEVDPDTRRSLVNLLPGETGVRIAPHVLAEATAAYQAR